MMKGDDTGRLLMWDYGSLMHPTLGRVMICVPLQQAYEPATK